MTNVRTLIIIAVLGLMLTSCGLITESPTPEAMIVTNTDSPTQRSDPVIEESPAITPTEAASTTESDTDVPDEVQQIPDKPLSDEGPWWIFSTNEGLFAINPDGSGLTQFYFESIKPPYSRQILAAPSGGHLAYIVGSGLFNATLRINIFPWHTLITEKPLTSNESEPETGSMPGDPEVEAVRAITEVQSMAFSPNGRFLAFMGAMDGPTSDLYIYSLDSYETIRLTDGPSQAYQPVWSPDGKYIVHTGVSTFGTGAGYNMSGIWAARVEDAEAVTLYDPTGSSSESILGWIDDQTFVVHSWDPACGSKNLRTFNIETKETSELWPESFRSVAFDPTNSVSVLISNDGGCSPNGGVGTYLVPTDGNPPRRIVEQTGPQVIWSQEAELFLVYGNFWSWFLAIDSHGQFIDLDVPPGALGFPAVAPGSRTLAWTGNSLWIGPLLGSIENPPREIFPEPVYTVTWDPNGKSVLFFSDSGLYVAHQPDYTPILVVGGLDNRNGYSGWVLP